MTDTGAGKGDKRRKGENQRAFDVGHDHIKWPSAWRKKKKPLTSKDEVRHTT